MKVAIITDQHFGARGDAIHFLDYYEKFYRETFFRVIDENNINTVLILGDTFDRRKYINFYSFHRAKSMFFDELHKRKIKVHMLVGNHDTYYKNTNEVNSPELLLEEYDNINVIDSPRTINVDSIDICMMPWICTENYTQSMQEIKDTSATICMGHFEIQGFTMHRGAVCTDGLEPSMFDKFDLVFSGHYHHRSSNGSIHYLGNPYELTWMDYGDPRGFHLFDLKTKELEFIENPNRMFHRIVYDDKQESLQTLTSKDLSAYKGTYEESLQTIASKDLSAYKGTYVKVVVVNKTNPYMFDVFINNLYKVNPVDIAIVEDFADIEESEDDVVNETEDTTTILNKYVDNLTTDLNKDKLKVLLKELYVEALNQEV
jgi:DNA repair exonuclease SbcCD nuclease subunit